MPLAELLAPPADEPGVHVVRAGGGPSVPGSATEAELLRRFDRPGLFGELYAIRFVPVMRVAPNPDLLGVVEHLHLHAGHARVGPRPRHPRASRSTPRAAHSPPRSQTTDSEAPA